MDRQQVAVVKEFMKAGKPVLACLGRSPPALARKSRPSTASRSCFGTAASNSAARRSSTTPSGRHSPPREPARCSSAAVRPSRRRSPRERSTRRQQLAPNPIAAALRLTGRTSEQSLALELRAPRPVYLAAGWQKKIPFVSEFLFTPPGAWNEERPFVTADRAGRVTYIPRIRANPGRRSETRHTCRGA